jgi:hypothetical protein
MFADVTGGEKTKSFRRNILWITTALRLNQLKAGHPINFLQAFDSWLLALIRQRRFVTKFQQKLHFIIDKIETRSGVDVMITIFCDFCQLSAKQLAFFSITNVMIKHLHNLALFSVKNAIFTIFFCENIFKIIISVPATNGIRARNCKIISFLLDGMRGSVVTKFARETEDPGSNPARSCGF